LFIAGANKDDSKCKTNTFYLPTNILLDPNFVLAAIYKNV
jgi:hypothetical protein